MSENFSRKKELSFIIGIGRSGTTLLTKLLIRHPEIHCLPEANFLVFFLNAYKNKSKFSSEDVSLIFEQIETYSLTHPWIGWDFNIEETRSLILGELENRENISYQELCELIYSDFHIKGISEDEHWLYLDKNPSFTIFTDKIISEFPDARFIWLVRDYRANVLSRKQHPDLKSGNVPFNATRWKLFNDFAFKFYQKNKEKVLLLKYEDLVNEPDKNLEKIYDFFELSHKPLHNEDVQIEFDSRPIKQEHKERFQKKYNDLNQPVNAGRLYSWKSDLSSKEIKICETICEDSGKKAGYEATCKLSLPARWSIMITVLGPVFQAYFDFYKDRMIYYFPVKLKLKRLIRRYRKLGFNKPE